MRFVFHIDIEIPIITPAVVHEVGVGGGGAARVGVALVDFDGCAGGIRSAECGVVILILDCTGTVGKGANRPQSILAVIIRTGVRLSSGNRHAQVLIEEGRDIQFIEGTSTSTAHIINEHIITVIQERSVFKEQLFALVFVFWFLLLRNLDVNVGATRDYIISHPTLFQIIFSKIQIWIINNICDIAGR